MAGDLLEFFNYGWLVQRLLAAQVLRPPTGDKAGFEPLLGALCVHSDNALYVGNGTEWVLAIGAPDTGGTGIFEPVITASDADKFWNGLKDFVQINADQLVNGSTNKFFTNALARAAISASLPLHYNAATGVLTIDPAAAQVLHGTAPILYDESTGTFSIDLAALDLRYLGTSPAALVFSSGLSQASGSNQIVALTDNALWNAKKLQGYDVTAEEPVDGTVLIFNGTTSTWELAPNIYSVRLEDDFANDTTAATGNIAVGGLYHTSGAVKIRRT